MQKIAKDRKRIRATTDDAGGGGGGSGGLHPVHNQGLAAFAGEATTAFTPTAGKKYPEFVGCSGDEPTGAAQTRLEIDQKID